VTGRGGPGGPGGQAGPGGRAGSRVLAFGAALLGAGAVVLASGRDWVTVPVSGVATAVVRADGRTAAPGAVAVALVAVAGAVVLVTAGRVGRVVVAALLLLAGVAVGAFSVPVWQSPRAAADAAVVRVTGTAGARYGAPAQVTVWPAVSTTGGALIAAAGLVGLVRGRRWPGPSRRYERDAAAAGPPTEGSPTSASATARPAADRPPAEVTGSAVTGSAVTGSTVTGSAAAAGSERDRRADVWDSLTRGEDPTQADPPDPGEARADPR